MTYVIHYRRGKVVREGKGLAFTYFVPMSSISAVPLGSNDLPFIFTLTASDFQTVSIQGQVSYKIANPKQLAELLDFTLDDQGNYKKDDTEKMNQRIVNEAQTSISATVSSLGLKEAFRAAKKLEESISTGLKNSKAIPLLGIEVLGVNILAIKGTPEMERALEAETREKISQEADLAIYERRNFAVEQERKIKESELNTEIAVEEKKKQITEKKMESEVLTAENDRKLREMKVQADISVEQQKKDLVEMRSENQKKEADTDGYVMSATLKPYKEMDWRVLAAINKNFDARSNIALGFRLLAENADKIGNLNITPDLLENLITEKIPKKK